MEKEKVFVLLESFIHIDGGENSNVVVGVYRNYEQAHRKFEELMVEGRKLFEQYDKEEQTEINVRRNYKTWEVWEDGQWESHHYYLQLLCQEIK